MATIIGLTALILILALGGASWAWGLSNRTLDEALERDERDVSAGNRHSSSLHW